MPIFRGAAAGPWWRALFAAGADPATMAALAKRRRRAKIPVLEQALTGIVHDHHRQLLAMQLAHIDFLDEQIEALNAAIERLSGNLSPPLCIDQAASVR